MDILPFTIDWSQRDVLTIFIGFASAILTLLIGRWLARLLIRLATHSMERTHIDPMVIRFERPGAAGEARGALRELQRELRLGRSASVAIVARPAVDAHSL